jgi:hypothetical protein
MLIVGAMALATPLAAQDPAKPPAEVAGGQKAPGVQRGGAEIRVQVGGTQTLVRGEPDDPRDTRPPEIYGEELCPATDVRGQFEPVQGVWQDDLTFTDRPGKQITRLSPTSWGAELPMVTGRKTALFGIDHAVGGAEPRRDEIFVKGEASGALVPVFFRFTLEQPGSVEVVYESEIVGQVPIGGPCGPTPVPFEVILPASDGVPRQFTFEFRRDGEYTLTAELVTGDGRPTGIAVSVVGQSRRTHAPSLAFRPVALLASSLESSSRAGLEAAAREIRVESALRIPDLYPVVNAPLRTEVFPLKDQSGLLDRREGRRRRPIDEVAEKLGSELEKVAVEELVRELQVGGLMSGFDRVVAIVSRPDHELLKRWLGTPINSVAWAASQKVVFLDRETGINVYTVAHEVAHTLNYLYSSPEMQTECTLDYHNVDDDYGHGHQLTDEGLPSRRRRDYSPSMMGPARESTSFALVDGILIVDQAPETNVWIEQCTYWHLLWILSSSPPDPPVVLIQGFAGRGADGFAGAILPLYEFESVTDIPSEEGEGGWAIVLKDASGAILSRHVWEPVWRIPHLEVERNLVSFAFRLLRPPALARVELQGPDGVVDAVDLSASAPRVTILRPAAGETAPLEEGAVRVEWSGTDADDDPLLYTVFYSGNGGETWMDVAFETDATSVLVPIDPEAPAHAHRVLVRATDGGRSADALLTLSLPEGGP